MVRLPGLINSVGTSARSICISRWSVEGRDDRISGHEPRWYPFQSEEM